MDMVSGSVVSKGTTSIPTPLPGCKAGSYSTKYSSPANCFYHVLRVVSTTPLMNHFIDTSDNVTVRYPCALIVICRDFNELDTMVLQEKLHLS